MIIVIEHSFCFNGHATAVLLGNVAVDFGLAVEFEDAVFRDEIRGAAVEVGVGGEINAAAIAVGLVIANDTVLYAGRAFQQQASATNHVGINHSEIVLNETVLNTHWCRRATAVPTHWAAVVLFDVAVFNSQSGFVVAKCADGAVGSANRSC